MKMHRSFLAALRRILNEFSARPRWRDAATAIRNRLAGRRVLVPCRRDFFQRYDRLVAALCGILEEMGSLNASARRAALGVQKMFV